MEGLGLGGTRGTRALPSEGQVHRSPTGGVWKPVWAIPTRVVAHVPSGRWEVAVGARGLRPTGTPGPAVLSPVTVVEGLPVWGLLPGPPRVGASDGWPTLTHHVWPKPHF